jgi:hypothetical protein
VAGLRAALAALDGTRARSGCRGLTSVLTVSSGAIRPMNISGNCGYLGFNRESPALPDVECPVSRQAEGMQNDRTTGYPGGAKGEDGGVSLRQARSSRNESAVRLCG